VSDLLELEKKPDVWVGNEWGELKEVVIGRPDQLQFPIFNDMVRERLKVLHSSDRTTNLKFEGMLFKDAIPDRFRIMVDECEAFVKLLEDQRIVVRRPRLLNADELKYNAFWLDGCHSLFLKDPIIVVGNIVIEGGNRTPWRHKDMYSYRELFFERVLGSNAKWICMPRPAPNSADPTGGYGPYLTGGDVFPMGGRNVLLGFNDVDSNIWGLRWIADLLRKEGWKVHSVRYRNDCMHLDTAMSCPAKGVALACKEFFIDGLPDILEGWEIVDVDPEEARADACNGLPLGRGYYVMSTEWKKYGEKLRDHGIKPLYTPFEETNHVTGGGPRCSHGPLVREDQ
jgi:glycine amidinotransferase